MASSKPTCIQGAMKPLTYPSSLWDNDENVNWYCNECQDSLSDRCKDFHSRGEKPKNHDIVPIVRADRQTDKPVPKVCKVHPGKLRDLFCSDCEEVLCSVCVLEKHKQHNWKHLEQIVPTLKRHLNEHMTTVAKKVEHFKTAMSHLERNDKISTNIIKTTRDEVNFQREKLLAEVNNVADAVLKELSILKKKQSAKYKEDCQQYQTKVGELIRLHDKADTSRSVESMLETEKSMRSTFPRRDVNVKTGGRKYPRFATGCINRDLLRKMFGELDLSEKKDINSKYVQQFSKFIITQKSFISDICPFDDSHAWLSIHKHKGLVLVNKTGVVRDTVTLDFCPFSLAMMGTTDILMTSNPPSTLVYKLSLHDKHVETFADISPREAYDISTNRTGEVFVSTRTPERVSRNTIRFIRLTEYAVIQTGQKRVFWTRPERTME
ncbi:uncharacterized protein [Argopecten irradians]|uniref:uncharacterized protein n=1 Tax=Argopecten irradians TaxID=31199 RepID=UPI00372374A3